MALVNGAPFLQLLLERLRAQGIHQVVLGTGYLAEQIESYFGTGEALDLSIRYSRENAPLGTGGAIKLAEHQLSDPCLILNGDSYVAWSIELMLELFVAKSADLVMVVQSVPEVDRYGSVSIEPDGRVTHFCEKGSHAGPGLINAGVYLLRKKIVRQLRAGEPVSFERGVLPRLLKGAVYGITANGPFIDIGVPEDLQRAQSLLARRTDL